MAGISKEWAKLLKGLDYQIDAENEYVVWINGKDYQMNCGWCFDDVAELKANNAGTADTGG